MNSATSNLVSGMVFGSGLTLSGVASPRVIQDQFQLGDFHMLITFLTASASSAAIIVAYNSRKPAQTLPVKPRSSLGFLGPYDGNIIGGSMVGAGMVLTGACPGTVLVQAVAGLGQSRLLALTSVIAGVAFVKWKRLSAPFKNQTGEAETVMTSTGWTPASTVIVYETAMLAMIALSLRLGPRSHNVMHPILGGLLIGIGQLSSVVLVKKPVGISSIYEDVGNLFWDFVDSKKALAIPGSVLFVAGLLAGAFASASFVPVALGSALQGAGSSSILSTVVGGFLLTFGARIAGGCTSGHGISGMASMGLSSFITVASMFGSGLVLGLLRK